MSTRTSARPINAMVCVECGHRWEPAGGATGQQLPACPLCTLTRERDTALAALAHEKAEHEATQELHERSGRIVEAALYPDRVEDLDTWRAEANAESIRRIKAARDRLQGALEAATKLVRRCSALKCHRDNDPRKETPDCGTCPPCGARAWLALRWPAVDPTSTPDKKESPEAIAELACNALFPHYGAPQGENARTTCKPWCGKPYGWTHNYDRTPCLSGNVTYCSLACRDAGKPQAPPGPSSRRPARHGGPPMTLDEVAAAERVLLAIRPARAVVHEMLATLAIGIGCAYDLSPCARTCDQITAMLEADRLARALTPPRLRDVPGAVTDLGAILDKYVARWMEDDGELGAARRILDAIDEHLTRALTPASDEPERGSAMAIARAGAVASYIAGAPTPLDTAAKEKP